MVDATPQTHTRRLLVLLSLAVLLATGNAAAQQQADTLFQPVVAKPAYAPGAGPVVFVNEAHHNSPCDTGLSVALPILRRIFSSIPSFPLEKMEIEHLKNIGPTTAQWLHDAGLHTQADLEDIGAVMAYKVLQHQRPQKVNIMLLYALQGALMGVHWNALPPELKAQLKRDAQERLRVL